MYLELDEPSKYQQEGLSLKRSIKPIAQSNALAIEGFSAFP